jgi:hypothetical protein
VERIREKLEAERFDEMFAAGSRLNQRQAVAAACGQRDASAATS